MTRYKPPQKARRDDNEKHIAQALRAMGFGVVLVDKPFDMVIWRKGQTWIGEVKDPKKRGHKDEFTPSQKDLIEKDFPVVVFYEIADAASFANSVINGVVEIPLVGTVS